jgi:hypothetical protein
MFRHFGILQLETWTRCKDIQGLKGIDLFSDARGAGWKAGPPQNVWSDGWKYLVHVMWVHSGLFMYLGSK